MVVNKDRVQSDLESIFEIQSKSRPGSVVSASWQKESLPKTRTCLLDHTSNGMIKHSNRQLGDRGYKLSSGVPTVMESDMRAIEHRRTIPKPPNQKFVLVKQAALF